jgi:hypothetical protein
LRNDLLKKEVSGFFINPKSSTLAASTRSSMFFQAIANICKSRRKDLGKEEVMAERTEKDHAGHNSGGVGRATAASLDDESSQSCNSNLLVSAMVIKT